MMKARAMVSRYGSYAWAVMGGLGSRFFHSSPDRGCIGKTSSTYVGPYSVFLHVPEKYKASS